MNGSFRPLLAALALGSAIAGPLMAQAPASSATDTVDANAVVDAARALVRDNYVLPATAVALDQALAEAQRAGTFAGLSGQQLSAAITRVMRTVTPDGHLNAMYNPEFSAQLAARPESTGSGPQKASPEEVREIVLANGGVEKLQVLPGNVRYMDYTGFMWGAPAAKEAIATAAEFLRGGSAIIIDLRHNGGGSSDAVADLASWFMPPDTPLMQFVTRGGEEERSQTSAKPFTLADRPVYVLTAKRSFSAAEEFAAHVAAFGFGTLVGETTGGGGFNNTFYPLPGGLAISISTGQAVQLKTGKGWEQVGIAPAIAVPQDLALFRAQADALAALAQDADPAERAALAKMEPVFRARAEGRTPERPLEEYVGSFGPLEVSLSGGQLNAVTPNGPSELVALGGNEFAPAIQPELRVQYVFEGDRAGGIELITANGRRQFPRS